MLIANGILQDKRDPVLLPVLQQHRQDTGPPGTTA